MIDKFLGSIPISLHNVFTSNVFKKISKKQIKGVCVAAPFCMDFKANRKDVRSLNSVNKIQEIECIEEKIKEILIETILENNNIECEGAWYAKSITSEEFDSLSMVNFMVAI